MKTRAAVAFGAGKPLEIVEVDLEGPRTGEVLVEMKATGVCHTDAFTLSGDDPEGAFPAILGHEGAGVVVEVGPGVKTLKPGDHVRKLMMTFKEQAKGAKKGFQEKWSRDTYQVLRVSALRRNPQVKKYSIGDPNRTYFRHELLLIPSEVDQVVMAFPTSAPYLVEDRWRPQ